MLVYTSRLGLHDNENTPKTQVLGAGPGEKIESQRNKSQASIQTIGWQNAVPRKKNGQPHEGLEGPCPALPPSCPALSTSPQTTGFFLRIPLPQSKEQKPVYNKHSSRIELNGLTHFLPFLRLILQKDDFKEIHR